MFHILWIETSLFLSLDMLFEFSMVVSFLTPLSRGGDEGVRTPDPLRARQVLSQLSYTPIDKGSIFHLFESLLRFLSSGEPSKLNNALNCTCLLCFAFGRHFGLFVLDL